MDATPTGDLQAEVQGIKTKMGEISQEIKMINGKKTETSDENDIQQFDILIAQLRNDLKKYKENVDSLQKQIGMSSIFSPHPLCMNSPPPI